MIQSPRGSKDSIALDSFDRQDFEPRYYNTPDNDHRDATHNNTSISQNQLFSTNTSNYTLSPPILCQLAYSNKLLHMTQSAKTPLEFKTFAIRRESPNRMETMIINFENGENGTRQHRSRRTI